MLLPYIHSYVYMIGEISQTHEEHITRFFPSVMTQFVFDFYGDHNRVVEQGHLGLDIRQGTYIKSGIGTWIDLFQKENLSPKRRIKMLKVSLYPNVLYEVFGISPFEIKNEDVSVEAIWGREEGALLYEALDATHTGEAMIEIFEHHFMAKLARKSFSSNALYQNLLVGYNAPSLHTFSQECGYSERWIQKRYLEIFGESFKQIQNNLRFVKALKLINQAAFQGERHLNFTSIAYQCNYFDQTHFIKEFKKFTGLTPSSYFNTFREKIPVSWLW